MALCCFSFVLFFGFCGVFLFCFFQFACFPVTNHPPVSYVCQWVQELMPNGQQGLISSFMTTPFSAPHREGWLIDLPGRSHSPKNRNTACCGWKGMGLHYGGPGFKSHPPAGVMEALYKFLKSSKLQLPHLENGDNTKADLVKFRCPSAHETGEETPLTFKTPYGLQRSREFRKYFWKQIFLSPQNAILWSLSLSSKFFSSGDMANSHVTANK